MSVSNPASSRKPAWLRRDIAAGGQYAKTSSAVEGHTLHTICQEARCPNRGECWGRGTATFLILGDVCTRRCEFCSVKTGNPMRAIDAHEPGRVAEAAGKMGLKYVVITSVDRDDLPDKGAGHFRDVMEAVRRRLPDTGIEILTPDFRGAAAEAIETLLPLAPFVWAHNVETVPRLYPSIKRGARYDETLGLLKQVKAAQDVIRRAGRIAARVPTKSSIMLGLGEREDEVREVLRDMRAAEIDIVTIGQYMRPSSEQAPVVEYVRPEIFSAWEEEARAMGFRQAHAGPFVRSSYKAEMAAPLLSTAAPQ